MCMYKIYFAHFESYFLIGNLSYLHLLSMDLNVNVSGIKILVSNNFFVDLGRYCSFLFLHLILPMKSNSRFYFLCKWPLFFLVGLLEFFLYPCYLKILPMFLGVRHFNLKLVFSVWVGVFVVIRISMEQKKKTCLSASSSIKWKLCLINVTSYY